MKMLKAMVLIFLMFFILVNVLFYMVVQQMMGDLLRKKEL